MSKAGDSVIREVKGLEFAARHIWPLARIMAKKVIAKRCAICGLSEICSPLENNVCGFCREHASKVKDDHSDLNHELMTNKLDAIFTQYEGRGTGAYDALLLFSGGKDSTYLLHRLIHEHPSLRILAFTVNNNFMSPIAMSNIENVISGLHVDHVVYRPDFNFSKAMFRYAFTHVNEKGCSGTVDQCDGDSILDFARNYAAQQKIPLVIMGISPIQVERHIGVNSFETPVEEERKRREQVAGMDLDEMFDASQRRYWWDGTAWDKEDIPRVLFPFYAWGYDEQHVKSEVAQLGLLPSNQNSPLITNNQLVPLMTLVDIAHLGYSSFEPEFCRLVREKKAELGFWRNIFEMAEYSAKTGRFIKDSIDRILSLLSLTRQDVGMR